MKTWTETPTLAALAVLFTLPLAGCTDDGPDVAAVPDAEPGDPAVYAPDGWPLQIGDRVSYEEWSRLRDEFQLPGVEPRVEPLNPAAHAGYTWRSPWNRRAAAMNLVGGRVYAARIDYDPTKIGDYDNVYRGHFRIRFKEFMRHYEPDLPPEFHGKVEYYTSPPLSHAPPATLVIDRGMWDADGRRLKPSVDWVLDPLSDQIDRLKWPDYPERRK